MMPSTLNRLLSWSVYTLVAAAGCRKLEPVPEGVDANAAWLYRNQPEDADVEIAAGLRQMRADLALDDLDEYVERLLEPLDADTVASVGMQSVAGLSEEERAGMSEDDIEAAIAEGSLVRLSDQQGMLVATRIPCSIEDTVEVFVRLDQDVIHPDYQAYQREYTSDRDAFGLDTPLSWETHYTVSVIGFQYDARILGQIRWVTDDEGGPPFALARAHLPEPGAFKKGEDAKSYFRQDYQLDAFYETDDGQTLHLFAVWRDMNLGGGLHSSNAGYIATVSKAFRDGDLEIAEFCAGEGGS